MGARQLRQLKRVQRKWDRLWSLRDVMIWLANATALLVSRSENLKGPREKVPPVGLDLSASLYAH